jgi:hypothetical protein
VERVIRKSKAFSSGEARELVSALFAIEVAAPGKCLWLVSPWITDLAVLDNSAGTYSPLKRWGDRPIRLVEVLVSLALSGTLVVIGTTPDPHNRTFLGRLEALTLNLRVGGLIDIQIDAENALHTKSIVADDFALVGSMNLTVSGVDLREEYLELKTDQSFVSQARIDSFERFGGVL